MTSWTENSVKYLHRVRLGVRISNLTSDKVVDLSRFVGSYYNKGKYILLTKKSTISVIMHKDSMAADVLRAFMHALVLAKFDDKDKSMHVESQSWVGKKL